MDLAFGKLDSNGDGYIDLDELIARLPSLTGVDNPESERMLAVGHCCVVPRGLLSSSILPRCQLGAMSTLQGSVDQQC